MPPAGLTGSHFWYYSYVGMFSTVPENKTPKSFIPHEMITRPFQEPRRQQTSLRREDFLAFQNPLRQIIVVMAGSEFLGRDYVTNGFGGGRGMIIFPYAGEM